MNSMWISGFLALPTELINDIIKLSAASELPSLCRVSKKFNSVATRLLYHTIVLQSPRTAIRCFQTIVASESVALSVRSLEMYRTIPSVVIFAISDSWSYNTEKYHHTMISHLGSIGSLPPQSSMPYSFRCWTSTVLSYSWISCTTCPLPTYVNVHSRTP